MNMTISALQAAYAGGTLTPRALVASLLQRCDETQAHNIWITRLNAEQLRPYLERLDQCSPKRSEERR